MTSARQAFILGPGDGRKIDLGNFVMSVKATAEQTSGAFILLEATEPPGFGPPMHIHHDAAEAFYVLDGQYIVFVEGREQPCPAGSFIFLPAGVNHGFRVGDAPSRKLNFYIPAAMIGYFDELSEAVSKSDVSQEAINGIAERYSMEVTGPAPELYV